MLSFRIMWLSGIAGHGAKSLLFQWGGTIKLPWMHTVTNLNNLPSNGLVPIPWSTASHLAGPLFASGTTIAADLQPVPWKRHEPLTIIIIMLYRTRLGLPIVDRGRFGCRNHSEMTDYIHIYIIFVVLRPDNIHSHFRTRINRSAPYNMFQVDIIGTLYCM